MRAPLSSREFGVGMKTVRGSLMRLRYVRRYWSVHTSGTKQAKVDKKEYTLFIEKDPDLQTVAHALVERKRFILIFRKLRSEETRKITLFYREFLQGYRN